MSSCTSTYCRKNPKLSVLNSQTRRIDFAEVRSSSPVVSTVDPMPDPQWNRCTSEEESEVLRRTSSASFGSRLRGGTEPFPQMRRRPPGSPWRPSCCVERRTKRLGETLDGAEQATQATRAMQAMVRRMPNMPRARRKGGAMRAMRAMRAMGDRDGCGGCKKARADHGISCGGAQRRAHGIPMTQGRDSVKEVSENQSGFFCSLTRGGGPPCTSRCGPRCVPSSES
jgi:hypothetical protein